jgi:glycosyltransferase involved in cell wall biosynthesis
MIAMSKHSLAFVLSRRITLTDLEMAAAVRVNDHRDGFSVDVAGLRRGLHFVSIEFTFSEPLVGPLVSWQDHEREGQDEVFIFEHGNKHEIFGTVLIGPHTRTLNFYPSRLATTVKITRASVRPMTEFARQWIYGVAYVQWKMFGLPWLIEKTWGSLLSRIKSLYQPVQNAGYAAWWQTYGRCSVAELDAQRIAAPVGPLISIVLPTYRPRLDLLEQAVASVREQTYPHWQLCICDDGSADPALDKYLNVISADDSRIKIISCAENGHISVASNTAIALAEGDFIGFLDHDDLLTPNALYEYVAVTNANPELQLLYSDEDIVDDEGSPINGHFKPDWNYDLARSINYVCHFLMIKSALVRACGGLREGMEGAQDFDLLLRVTERIPREAIHHVPKILYHWRATAGSTAAGVANKPYALAQHLERMEIAAVAEHSEIETAYRVRYVAGDTHPAVSIIVPTYNNVRALRNCIRSVLELTDYTNYELLIVDNRCDDVATLKYLSFIASDARIRVLGYPHPFNFSAINNFAVAQTDADIVLMLNDDTEVVHGNWLQEMVSQAERPEVGAVGAKLLYANNRIQHAGVLLGLGGDQIAGHAFKGRHKNEVGALARTRLVQEYSAVTGACLAVSREKYLAVGGLEEEHLAVAYNDVDFCLKLLDAGYRNIWTPYAQLYHFESYTRGPDSVAETIDRYQAEADYMRTRWSHRLASDPHYNRNLSRGLYSFELAWPPYPAP